MITVKVDTALNIRSIMRQSQIESGHFMKPKTVFFKDKSKYSRKIKHTK